MKEQQPLPPEHATISDPQFTILDQLRATAPHPDLKAELALFGQFVGAWEMEVTFFDEQGNKTYHQYNEWRFSWILDGLGIQDTLFGPHLETLSNAPGSRRIGTSMRLYDQNKKIWHVSWFGVTNSMVVHMRGGKSANGIELKGQEDNGHLLKWNFSAIKPSSFIWKGYVSTDDGQNWYQRQLMTAKRLA